MTIINYSMPGIPTNVIIIITIIVIIVMLILRLYWQIQLVILCKPGRGAKITAAGWVIKGYQGLTLLT
jgi:hypothetical protein